MFSSNRVLKSIALTAVAAPLLWGCGSMVTREEYDHNVNALQQANDSLKRRNMQLEAMGSESEQNAAALKLYGEISEQLKQMLAGVKGGDGFGPVGGDVKHWRLTDEAFLFDSGKSAVKPKFKQKLTEFVNSIKGSDTVYLRIVGHTDSAPIDKSREHNPTGMNLELGARRAIVVADIFNDAGFPELRMLVESAGASQPIASNSTKEGKAQNRRVDIYIGEGKPIPAEAGGKKESKKESKHKEGKHSEDKIK